MKSFLVGLAQILIVVLLIATLWYFYHDIIQPNLNSAQGSSPEVSQGEDAQGEVSQGEDAQDKDAQADWRELAKAMDAMADSQDRGKWEVKQTTDRIDDSQVVSLSLQAITLRRVGLLAASRDVATLIVRCKNRKTEAYIAWNIKPQARMEIPARVKLATRIDKKEATHSDWQTYLNVPSGMITKHLEPASFLKEILGGETLVVQNTLFFEEPAVVFGTTGLAHAIEPLRQACQW